ncbi:hypothetical protein [Paraburkholderia caribensis]|uniref:hypothetical protein n=1 Tax=Paraburkholderia caribensis TaxID=75105 RepID=UPI0028545FC4|nr:hypothetical protein [Paraburkholderia caribensis]MDR6381803.1 hypothetical protein [Paraburkholderia caribensis]
MTDSTRPPVPYPADTRAKGWRFELDLEQIDQSDTWALTPVELRPWLLMVWAAAWRQTPCGSLPDDDALIAVRIGMKASVFTKHRTALLRGFWKADDGRLYHDTISHRVSEMLAARDKERNRKTAYRQRKEAEKSGKDVGVPGLSHGTTTGHTGDSGGSDGTRTSTSTSNKNKNLSVPNGTDADASSGLTPHDAIFQIGVPWLVSHAGSEVKESNIRSMLGGAEKHLGAEGAWQLVQDCMRVKPFEPVAWVAGAINERKKVASSQTRRKSSDRNDRSAAAAAIFGTGNSQGEVIDV